MAFEPRLTPNTPTPMMNNPWWYSTGNPYYPTFQLPNCTCYTYGRIGEINDGFISLPQDDAQNWWDRYSPNVQKSNIPQVGSIINFGGNGTSGYGHVAVVEVINSDGSIITSNSGYNASYFWTDTLRPENNYIAPWMQDPQWNLYFQGFAWVFDTPPTPTTRKGLPIWMMTRKF